MSKEPMRILHITEMLSAAGIESFIMNVYRNIDREKVQFDFLVLRNEKEFYEDEITSLGGRKYYVHSNIKNTLLRILDESNKIEKFLKRNHYDIVHIHYTTPLRAFYLKAAKKAGVPVRIYHSHSAEVSGKSNIKLMIYNYCKKVIDKYATDFFACSEAAAKWIFSENTLESKKVKVIHNGIDTDRFSFKKEIRDKVRINLKLSDEFVLINTGRFTEQKNQMFLIDIVNELKKNGENVKLFLLGDGPLKEQCQEKVNKLELNDVVYFLGVKTNVEDYLFAADCYVMPSLYEGLPVAGVEAECTGIPCVFSENITQEVKFNENVIFVGLNVSALEWAHIVLDKHETKERENAVKTIRNAGYDNHDVALSMQNFYSQRVK